MSPFEHIGSKKKDILIHAKDLPDELDDTKLTSEKKYPVNSTEQQKKFCFSVDYNRSSSYAFVIGVDFYKFKAKSQKQTHIHCLKNWFIWLWLYGYDFFVIYVVSLDDILDIC